MLRKKYRCRTQWAICLLAVLLIFVHAGAVAARTPESRVLKVAPELERISQAEQMNSGIPRPHFMNPPIPFRPKRLPEDQL